MCKDNKTGNVEKRNSEEWEKFDKTRIHIICPFTGIRFSF
jgi:hypothetical protein